MFHMIVLTELIVSVENLDRKLSIYTESASGADDREITISWRSICQLEAECVLLLSILISLLIRNLSQRTQTRVLWH